MRRHHAHICALVACVTCAPAASGLSDAYARRPGSYDPGAQKGAAVGGAGLGLLGGLLLGLPVGGVAFVACGAGDDAAGDDLGGRNGLPCLVTAFAVLGLGGAMAGASAATWATGGRSPGDATATAMWQGAAIGALSSGLVAGGLIASSTGQPRLLDLGPDSLGASIVLGAILVSVGTGLGAAVGYELAYPFPFEKVSLVPTLSPGHAGLSMGFTF